MALEASIPLEKASGAISQGKEARQEGVSNKETMKTCSKILKASFQWATKDRRGEVEQVHRLMLEAELREKTFLCQ